MEHLLGTLVRDGPTRSLCAFSICFRPTTMPLHCNRSILAVLLLLCVAAVAHIGLPIRKSSLHKEYYHIMILLYWHKHLYGGLFEIGDCALTILEKHHTWSFGKTISRSLKYRWLREAC